MDQISEHQKRVYPMIEAHYRANFDRFVSQYAGRSGGRHNAEDIIQEAYARACKYCKTFKENRSFDGWLGLIVHNCFKDKRKEDMGMGMTYDKEGDEELYYGMTGAVQEDHLFLQDILQEIHEHKHSYILELALIDGLTYGEISEITPYTVNHIKQIISLFREDLRATHDINV